MLEPLPLQQPENSQVKRYLFALENSAFQGEIDSKYASRLMMATDNSIYQLLPSAVLFPRSTQDVSILCQLASETEFSAIHFSPRGGGTGTNGQSLTEHIVVDMSRHMQSIIDINIAKGWVKVQAGVIKDALNAVLRPLGYFFSPELSTSNRATIGGMISTDASGQGSLRYGKTSDNVQSITAVLSDGTVMETRPLPLAEIASLTDASLASQLLRTTAQCCQSQREEIEQRFPPLNRFLTGYDLKHAYDPVSDSLDITRLICGAEGTLAFVTEATLTLTKLPAARQLVNISYASFDAALRNAPFLVQANALSVETIDSTLLSLAREDIIWHQVSGWVADIDTPQMRGINLVEFAGEDSAQIDEQVTALCCRLDALIAAGDSGVLGYQVCRSLTGIEAIYAMRKKAVGLLGALEGRAKPVAFVEDTCVPPEHLADYIAEFRALLDAHDVKYGMFGHVDSGVLHVRPALDLCNTEQAAKVKQISDSVVELVKKYGGLMWGEHGRGFRAQYGPEFWGERLFTTLREIKTAWDPLNKLNPGKICTPLTADIPLAQVDSQTRGSIDRQIPITWRDSFSQALACNGNGLCFNYDVDAIMCPSMKVSQDRRNSPKGRAGLIREWLRLVAATGQDLSALEQAANSEKTSLFITLNAIAQRYQRQFSQQDDFSHEVMQSMLACLACKACATQCPVKVDVPSFRARFMQLYYTRYPRPIKDYLVANIETLLPKMAAAPRLINRLSQNSLAKWGLAKTLGYVDAPALSYPTLEAQLACRQHTAFDLAALEKLPADARANYVLIVQDPFTSFYEAALVHDCIVLLEKLGKTPVLVPFTPNGKAQHIKGFLREFALTATQTAAFFNQIAELGIPMLGVDAALTLCYRDEYNEALGDKRGNFQILTVHEWLLSEMATMPAHAASQTAPWYLLAHCTEKALLPNAEKQWQAIFAHFGLALENVAVGCCGMAGTYGHEAEHVADSKAIYALSWQTKLAQLPAERCLATGYSCRSQVKRMTKQQLAHPLQVLANALQTDGRY